MHTNLTPRRDAQVEFVASQKAKCFQGMAGPVAGCMQTPASLGSGIPASPDPRPEVAGHPHKVCKAEGRMGPGPSGFPPHPVPSVPVVAAAAAALGSVLLRGLRLLPAGLARLPLPARCRPLPSADPRRGRAWVPGAARARCGAGRSSWPRFLLTCTYSQTPAPCCRVALRPSF